MLVDHLDFPFGDVSVYVTISNFNQDLPTLC